ncbi:MAG: type II-A CRISPR-associated protein Csn2 [Christensenellales bacterium]
MYPDIDCVFDMENGKYNTLVIENQHLFAALLQDVYDQIEGRAGRCVLSQSHTPIAMDRYAEILDVFVPFSLNRRTLLGKITAAIEREALEASHYEQTIQVLQDIETLLDDVAFRFPCDLVYSKINIGSIIKACGIEVRDDSGRIGERVIDYMELVTEFDREKLFLTVNMRSFVSDEEMQLFADTAVSHGFQVLALENCEHPLLNNELRWTVDADLCEIG